MIFWREKAEGLDGELIDSRNANGQFQARLLVKQDALDKLMALMAYKRIPFSDAQHPDVVEVVDYLREYVKGRSEKDGDD